MKFLKNLNIKQKILLYTLGVTAIVFLGTIAFTGLNARQQVFSVTTDLADAHASEYAILAQDNLNGYMLVTRTLKQIFDNHQAIPEESRREILSSMLEHVLSQNPDFLSVWGIIDPGKLDNLDTLYVNTIGSTILGSFRYVYYRDREQILLSDHVEQDPEKVTSGYIYNQIRERLNEIITNPYSYSYRSDGSNAIYQTNMVAPVVKNGDFAGMVGVDVPLADLQEMIDGFQPVEGSFSFLFTTDGTIVTFPDRNLIGTNITDYDSFGEHRSLIMDQLQQEDGFGFDITRNHESYYVSIAPVHVGETGTPWFVGLAFPHQVIVQSAARTFRIAIFSGLLSLMLIGLVIWYIAYSITKPIKQLTSVIEKIALGNVGESLKLNINTGDEIAYMGKALNKYIDGYIGRTRFAQDIGKGNLDTEFELLSEDDHLAKSLIDMRDSLKRAKEEEVERQKEDKKRSWANEGLTLFADILRQNNDSLEELSFEIIRNMVKYLDANQGGVFLLNDHDINNIQYDLKASYAFDRRKFLEKSFKKGEGLVGTCAIEGKTTYLKKVPQSYVKIASGLGESNPDCILIVPLKKEQEILGVLELASFETLEDYKIEFVEKVAENIASTLQSVRISIKTNELLRESEEQKREMKSQEDSLMQNMEELMQNQELLQEKEQESKRIIEDLQKQIQEKEAIIKRLKKE